jgi:purine-nucleoside/S-methyl-5'-thioadenosine phosphorylase / adenosine deaminase
MTALPVLHSAALSALPHIRHGFFTRQGGVSRGIYATLNTGFGSGDAREAVAENRARCTRALGAAHLVTLYQVHSAIAVDVEKPFSAETVPEADGMASTARGLALGALAADCAPVLLADGERPVIGAAHSGWKGALTGILEATIGAMEAKGAVRTRIVAAVGPCISQKAYEVGPEFESRFLAGDEASAAFFSPGRGDRRHFDLPGYVAQRLRRAGLAAVEAIGRCTYEDEAHFFSYRRGTHRGAPDYGRNLSAIALV